MTALHTKYEKKKRIFGRKLCGLREQRDLSIQRMADETGFSRATIHKWEAGKAYPKSAEIFEILADYFHVPVSYLYQETCSFADLVRRVEILENKMKKVVHNGLLFRGGQS